MKFMTAGTLRNMPAYLAANRQRRQDSIAEEERKKKESLIARMRSLGQEFMRMGDYTPQGLQKFAQDNEMSMPEMEGMINMVINFKKLKTAGTPNNIWANQGGKRVRVQDQVGVKE